MAFGSGGRLGARAGRLGLPFRGPERFSWPEEQAEGGWAHARYLGPSAGGAAQGGSGVVVGAPRVPPLRPGGWQGRAGSSGSAHGRKPEAAEAGSPGQQCPGGGDGRGEGGGGPRGAMGKRRNGLPDRWTDYLPLGKRMSGTRFIAFKVPLKKSFEWKLAPDERFSPLDLITQVKEQKEELGLIIDLTYTTRYYEPMELPDTLQYCKILTIGQEVPNNAVVSKFKSTVKKFLKENQHNDKLIGVHCTHGLNRTGYLVCRYLIDVEGMDPNMAIELFNRCRGHSIEKKNYISALQRTSGTRNHHHTNVSQWDWRKGPVDYTPSPDYEVADYGPQNWKHAPRNHHHMNVSQWDWRKGPVDYTPSPDYEVADYGPQNWKHAPRNHHHTNVSQWDWRKGPVDYTPSPDYEVADYGPQNWKHAPRNFQFRRGGRSQKRKHSQIWNQNLITCYSEGTQAYSPQHPPAADIMHQRSGHNGRPSNRLFSQGQFQGYQRPSFQELNPHGSLQQHRNQIDKQHYWIP